jgi:hypothetical protein
MGRVARASRSEGFGSSASGSHGGWRWAELMRRVFAHFGRGRPIAQAYAGHQFGHFTALGDGRAILIGEQITPFGDRLDIQLKGAGQTRFSPSHTLGARSEPCFDANFGAPARPAARVVPRVGLRCSGRISSPASSETLKHRLGTAYQGSCASGTKSITRSSPAPTRVV